MEPPDRSLVVPRRLLMDFRNGYYYSTSEVQAPEREAWPVLA